MLSVLTHPTYARLFTAQALSLVGTGLTTVALGLLAYELAGADAGAVLGTALAIKMIAYVGVSPIAGALAGFLPRRGFLVGLDLCRASLVLLLPFVDQVWQIYVLVFLFQACSAAFTPTFQATIPDVLPEERDYTRALSLSRLAYDLESLLSPALTGMLLFFMSFHWLFVGTAIGFLASAAFVLSTRLPVPQAATDASFRSRLTRGAWIYLATPRLRGLLALYVAVASAGAMVIVNTVVFVKSGLGGSDSAVALFLAASGFGSMIVALSLPDMLEKLSIRSTMLSGAAVLVAALLLASLGPGYAGGLGLWFILGAGSSLVQTPAGLLLRRSSHSEDRPALFSAQFALSHACWLIAYPAAGWIGAAAGLSVAFAVMAVSASVGLIAAMRLWPRDDPAELVHDHPEIVHAHVHEHDAHHDHDHEGCEATTPHNHRHRHRPMRHSHVFVIDDHHPVWPQA